MVVIIKKGSKLTQKEIKDINFNREKEFGSKKDILPKPGNEDWNNIFFFLRNPQGELRAFGKVEDITINHLGKPYSVYCVSTVVATPKGCGYGTQIMKQIKKYAQDKEKTLIGFCETSLLPFYKKCGFAIFSREENQFVYSDSEGNIIPNIVPGEVFFLDGKDEIIGKILSGTDRLVKVPNKA